jgi:hypothetical protein
MADETVAGLEGPEADINVTEETRGESQAGLAPRSPRRRPVPSVDDDTSWRKETAPAKVESHGGSHNCAGRLPGDTSANCQLPPCRLELSGEAPQQPSRSNLLDKDNVEKTTLMEARLRTQARLRVRLAAERRLAQHDG